MNRFRDGIAQPHARLTFNAWHRRVSGWVVIFGAAQFLFLSAYAAQLYPGGSPYFFLSEGYQFGKNPFSDLGRSYAWNGMPNSRSAVIYNPSLAVLATSSLIFYTSLFRFHLGRQWLLIASSVFGIISSIGLIGLSQTPYDGNVRVHEVFLATWLVPFILSAFFYCVATVRVAGTGIFLKWYSLLLGSIVLFYFLMGVIKFALPYYVAVQKIVVYGCMIWIVVAGVVTLKAR